MTIFAAPPYDPTRERRRRKALLVLFIALVWAAIFTYYFWDWPEQHVVNNFFSAIERQDFDTAYGIWLADPDWKLHPQRYARYSRDDFYQDWGPSGKWGIIRAHHITHAESKGSGVVVVVDINHRLEMQLIWVERKDKTLSFPPPYLEYRK